MTAVPTLRDPPALECASASRWLVLRRRTISVRTLELLAMPAAVIAGVAVRAAQALPASFPRNDGGMFAVMVRDIQDAGFRLPEATSYNGGGIPFAYPPGALYLAAALDALLTMPLTTLLVVLPLVGGCATVVAFAHLARAMQPRAHEAVLATFAFSLMPTAYAWLLPGGGLPRSFGLVLGLLALREAHLLASTTSRATRRIVVAGALAAATSLVHLETAAFVGLGFLVIAALSPRRGIAPLAAAAMVGLVVASPWWLIVLGRHGLDPFLASMDQGGALLDDGRISAEALLYAVRRPLSTGEAGFPILGGVACAGLAVSIHRRAFLVPALALAISLVAMRASPTFGSVPTALLAGAGLSALGQAAARTVRTRGVPLAWLVTVLIGMAAMLMGGAQLTLRGGTGGALETLPAPDRAAMDWARENTPGDAVFVHVPVSGWWVDSAGEWLPALSGRASLATPQGQEWVPGGFPAAVALGDRLRACAAQGSRCLEDAAGRDAYTHVFIPSRCCEPLRASLRESERFRVVYDDGALIAERR